MGNATEYPVTPGTDDQAPVNWPVLSSANSGTRMIKG
jgi:hypothetical protein